MKYHLIKTILVLKEELARKRKSGMGLTFPSPFGKIARKTRIIPIPKRRINPIDHDLLDLSCGNPKIDPCHHHHHHHHRRRRHLQQQQQQHHHHLQQILILILTWMVYHNQNRQHNKQVYHHYHLHHYRMQLLLDIPCLNLEFQK